MGGYNGDDKKRRTCKCRCAAGFGLWLLLVAHNQRSEAAIQGHAVFQLDGGGPVQGEGGLVDPPDHPDFVAGDGLAQGGSEETGSGPAREIALAAGFDIRDADCPRSRGRDQAEDQQGHGQEYVAVTGIL